MNHKELFGSDDDYYAFLRIPIDSLYFLRLSSSPSVANISATFLLATSETLYSSVKFPTSQQNYAKVYKTLPFIISGSVS